MKAIVVSEYGSEEVLNYQDVETPAPQIGEILVEIKAAGVNPVDTYVRQGSHPSAPPVPFTPGKDGAGVVAAIGQGVDKVAVGDRVYLAGSISGTYAEFAVATEDQVWSLPEKATFEQGAGIFVPYATSYRALFGRGRLKSGEKVLVHGASGAVGIAAIQWAKNAGAEVYGTAGSTDGLSLVKDIGADQVFDHAVSGYLDQIGSASGGGVDLILEMLANVNLVNDFGVLNKFGRIVVIGSRGSLEFDPRLTMGKDASILGLSLFNGTPAEFAEIHAAIFSGLFDGFLSPVVGKTFDLEQASAAHKEIIGSKAKGKIVLLP